MQKVVEYFITHGSYGLMFAALVAAGMGLPLPEDIVFIAGAILAQQGKTDLTVTVIVLTLGVFIGDSVLFFLARRIGPAILDKPAIQAALPLKRRQWLERMIEKHGGLVVFCARHVAGFRGPTFAMTAIHGISYWRFIFFDMLALAISMPVFMWLGYKFSGRLSEALSQAHSAEKYAILAVVGLVAVAIVWHTIRNVQKQRKLSVQAELAQLRSPEGSQSTERE